MQQGQLTAQLVQHLTSESEAVREIAIVALRESVPEVIYDAVAAVLARADDSARVRKTAIKQLGLSANSRVAETLGEIAADPDRPKAERYLASSSASRVSLSSPGTFVLTASSQFGTSIQSSELEGGVFTHFLLKGLSGEADFNADGTVSADELGRYVLDQVREYGFTKDGRSQQPMYSLQPARELAILGELAQYSEVTGLILGVGIFATQDLAPLAYAARDAERVYSLFAGTSLPSTHLRLLKDATRSQILSQLDTVASEALKDSLFVLYYAGAACY